MIPEHWEPPKECNEDGEGQAEDEDGSLSGDAHCVRVEMKSRQEYSPLIGSEVSLRLTVPRIWR